jgi:hypothetical protein
MSDLYRDISPSAFSPEPRDDNEGRGWHGRSELILNAPLDPHPCGVAATVVVVVVAIFM